MTKGLQLSQAMRYARHAGLIAFAGAAIALADGIAPPLRVASYSNEVEGSLVRAIVGLREHGLKQALSEVDEMLARNPNYKLGYLIKGDLLMASAGQPVAFTSNGAPPADVLPLREEARVRMKRYLDAPPTAELPATLLQLAPNQQHALVIDTSTNRIFVFANDLGRPRYVTDFYISLGRNGVEKQREGDQKTPIGVYTLLPMKDKLPEFYGPGAYPLTYPTEWDKVNGRSGHGIWLHGTPAETYARPPWATDGCVVLTNEDLAKLRKYVDVTRTPVVISPGVEWRAPNQWEAEREAFLADFTTWRKDWESLDSGRYLSHYSRDFRSAQRDYAGWSAKKRQVTAGKTWIKVGVNDMSLFEYPGEENLVMVSFEQDYRSNNLSKRTFKRQFWAREDGHWRIVHEAVVGS
ncbi:MAG TPA: L,D-transpeptidase family protein [Usitatibacter sp.]|nr:L,D-transpeptidase family protein [Usitatibacter sp.]